MTNRVSPAVVRVRLKERSYPVLLGSGILDDLGRLCRSRNLDNQVVIVADRNSARAGLKRARFSLRERGFQVFSIVIPPGERQKSLANAERIHSFLVRKGVSRAASIVALGGGVVGDLAGFVASTYRRGIAVVQCPTTLLSQVDSSVGGKNGVNLPGAKNVVGTFHQPCFVLADVSLLTSLPRRERISGLGEILKYPIVGDPDLLRVVEDNLHLLLAVEPAVVQAVARRCLTLKASLVSRDERETAGLKGRMVLNVGHTIGHALESLSQYKLRHGEAVFLGLIAEGHIAVRRGWFAPNVLDRFVGILTRVAARLNRIDVSYDRVVNYLAAKEPGFVLPAGLGKVRLARDVSRSEVIAALRFVRSV